MDGSKEDPSVKSAGDALLDPNPQSNSNSNNTTNTSNERPTDGYLVVVDSGPILSPSNDSKISSLKSWVTLRDLEYYKTTNKKRGYFVIFSFEKFDPRQNLPDREGNIKDLINLKTMAINLGFENLEIFYDLEKNQVLSALTELSRISHLDSDCFACAILTHGASDGVLYSYDEEMKLKDFTKPFEPENCPSLAEKPKLFFIQACRGRNLDPGSKVKSVDTVDSGLSKGYTEVFIPSQADFLIAQSTCPEFYAWRNIKEGSIFIQALCEVFNANYRTKDISQMLTLVNNTVAFDWASNSPQYPEFHQKKQIPSITSQLTKILRFEQKKSIDVNTTEEESVFIRSLNRKTYSKSFYRNTNQRSSTRVVRTSDGAATFETDL